MATKQIAWNTGSGNITLTYQGQGDGPVTVNSDPNTIGSARSQVINIETTAGSPVVTKNLTIRQGACPVPVGTVLNYAYTGSYQEVELPAGQYKLQCWGAQGGSNAAASSYGITAKAGGKGGYSEGVLTLTSKTTVRIYVGGAGSSSAGGYNGGGSTTGSSTYNASNEQGVSRMGGGGGATDIRLSDGALLSRMIVAGGGAGGAMCYQEKTTSSAITDYSKSSIERTSQSSSFSFFILVEAGSLIAGQTYTVSGIPSGYSYDWKFNNNANAMSAEQPYAYERNKATITAPSGYTYFHFYLFGTNVNPPSGFTIKITHSSSSTSTSTNYQVGGVGGGTQGGAYSSTYSGKQNAAGSGGSFGQGANQTATNYRYCSAAGGGGWYGGGGGQYSDSSMTTCKYSGGGSGFVNTSANSSYRPSGYTGLELDSGTTYDGSQSFPNTAGTGNETGHAGNGYVKITRQ